MADASELRKKHEELREKVTRARETLLEARAKQRSLDDRIAELTKELEALGVDPSKLDEAIATEESAINKELMEIESHLANPAPKLVTKPAEIVVNSPPPSMSGMMPDMDLDVLLNAGTS